MPAGPYDALLVISFGGPEGPDDVVPFLEDVTRVTPLRRPWTGCCAALMHRLRM